MGHHLDGKSSIVRLVDRLNKYPIGLPDSETLRQILAILFTEEEAFIGSRFPLAETTLPELMHATGWEQEPLRQQLEVMAGKGLVMDTTYGGKTFYLLMPGLIGFFEFSFMKQRLDLPVKELAQLMEEYLHGDSDQKMAKEFFGSKTPLTRALVYEEHIPVHSEVLTYESAKKIISTSSYGAIGTCYCRHRKSHLDESCKKDAPMEEICISLGTAAKFMVRRGFAEKRSKDQLLQILQRAKELNLTHVTDNIRNKPSFICNCCSCCCELLTGLQNGFPQGVAKTDYCLEINNDTCLGCGLCKKACNVSALILQNKPKGEKPKMSVLESHCLGCGACIDACPSHSLSLCKIDHPPPPATRRDLMKTLLKEKRRFLPFLFFSVKKKALRTIGMQ